MVGLLHTSIGKKKDPKNLKMIQAIMKVPHPVRREALTKYVVKCKDRYNIAFFQWRYRFPSQATYNNKKLHDRKLLEGIILARITKFVQDDINQDQRIDSETLANSRVTRDFLKKYDLIEKNKSFLVNSFWMIGWDDPFPDDDEFIIGSIDDPAPDLKSPEAADDWVYPEFRYVEGNAPNQIYIPRKEIMLKIMRACIGVKNPEDLWINSKDSQIENAQTQEEKE